MYIYPKYIIKLRDSNRSRCMCMYRGGGGGEGGGGHRLLHILTLYMEAMRSTQVTVLLLQTRSRVGLILQQIATKKVLLALTLPNCGITNSRFLSQSVMKRSEHPKHFPVNKAGIDFPVTVLKHTNRNGESYRIRNYLSWSEQLQALFCFPCRLFSTHDSFTKSLLASPRGRISH